jgi:hypothetical protein
VERLFHEPAMIWVKGQNCLGNDVMPSWVLKGA